jgi:hypothetical protein
MEALLLSRDLVVHNQPSTSSNGEANVDVTFSTRGVRVVDLVVHLDASNSDYRMITYSVPVSPHPRSVAGDPVCPQWHDVAVHLHGLGVVLDSLEVERSALRWKACGPDCPLLIPIFCYTYY